MRAASAFSIAGMANELVKQALFRLADNDGRAELANAAAHILLRRPPGSIAGRTALETFVDARVEELIANLIDPDRQSPPNPLFICAS